MGNLRGRDLTRNPSKLYSRSYEIIGQHFPSIVFDSQDVLTEPRNWEKVLAIIPDDGVQASLRSEWEKSPTRDPSKKWEDLKDAIGSAIAAVRH